MRTKRELVLTQVAEATRCAPAQTTGHRSEIGIEVRSRADREIARQRRKNGRRGKEARLCRTHREERHGRKRRRATRRRGAVEDGPGGRVELPAGRARPHDVSPERVVIEKIQFAVDHG